MPRIYTKQPLAERFWSKVEKTGDGCWLWTAYKTSEGYGAFRVGGVIEKAHRVAFVLGGGVLATGQVVMHICDRPSCCNPDHLRAGTIQENNLDRDQKGRQRTPRGEVHYARQSPDRLARGMRHGCALLTDADVLAIRQRYRAGDARLKDLAQEYSMSITTIHEIVSGQTWRHLLTLPT